jgi:amino acid adenylation domain-containing protein
LSADLAAAQPGVLRGDSFIVRGFADHAARFPGRPAVIFGGLGSSGGSVVSYAELQRAASAVAGELDATRAGAGGVVISVGRSPALPVALLGCLSSGTPWLLMPPGMPTARAAELAPGWERWLVAAGDADGLAAGPSGALRVETRPAPLQHDARPARSASLNSPAPGEDTAPGYVISTSGSTGKPKRVKVPAGSLASFVRGALSRLGVTPEDLFLASTSVAFDIALLELLGPLAAGAAMVLLDEEQHTDPALLLAAARRHEADIVQATPTMWRLLIDAGLGQGPERGRLRALCGGERLTPRLASDLLARTAAVHNMYGPVEATVWASEWRLPRDLEQAVSLGTPLPGYRFYVLNRWLRPAPPALPGELYIGGDCLADGYAADRSLTAARFLPDPYGAPGARMYRTGDLVVLREGVGLEFLGRADDQLKIRGHRVEPSDVENALREHPAVIDAAVIAEPDGTDGELRLRGFAAVRYPAEERYLIRHLRSRLPHYLVPASVLPLDRLPVTPSGKVDRRALTGLHPAPGGVSDAGAREPAFATATEATVADVFAALTGRTGVAADDDFFDLGGHSITAMRASARLGQLTDRDVPLRMIFESPVVARLAAAIDGLPAGRSRGPAPRPAADRSAPVPVSYEQQWMLMLDRLLPASALAMITVAEIAGACDLDRLTQAIRQVVRRHEVLRTCYRRGDGEFVQEVVPAERVPIAVRDVGQPGLEQALAAAGAELTARVNLRRDTAASFVLLRSAHGRCHLVARVHHVSFDAESREILLREIAAAYREPASLPTEAVQVADYAAWQREGAAAEANLRYWTDKLAGAPRLPLRAALGPGSAARDGRASGDSGASGPSASGPADPGAFGLVAFDCTPAQARLIRRVARSHAVTTFTVAMSCCLLAFRDVTGGDDITLSYQASARVRAELLDLIGMLAPTTQLRVRVPGSVGALLRAVDREVREGTDHLDVPMDRLLAQIQPAEPGGEPEPGVLVQLLRPGDGELELEPGTSLRASATVPGAAAAPADLYVLFLEGDEFFRCQIAYSARQFAAAGVTRLLSAIRTQLESLTESTEDQR